MATLILLRHGQSSWNLENRFTGWYDADLSDAGRVEATAAGEVMAAEGLTPTILHTSVQTRAIRTANLALDAMDRLWIPVRRHWRLNERHYGALQGLDKAETAEKFGAAQVKVWRRSYDIPPPPLDPDDERHPRHDPRYVDLPPDLLPAAECLKDVVDRLLPYWYDVIAPDLRAGHTVLVTAHGNSLRGLVKHLDHISDTDIVELNIPTGVPLVYHLDHATLSAHGSRYLGDPEAIAAAAAAVAAQAERKN
jgi:2,3-bisphosphoglycerate-dependent phosphoglycerate mutase